MPSHQHEPDEAQRVPNASSPVRRGGTPLARGGSISNDKGSLGRPRLIARLSKEGSTTGEGSIAVEHSPVFDVLSSAGRPLDEPVRTDMESRFGHDFSGVRVHTDDFAHRSAISVNAHAYTVGSHIAFQDGAFDPSSTAGRTVLAHELTHVLQQRSGQVEGTSSGAGIRVSDPSDRFEREAVATAQRLLTRSPEAEESRMENGNAVAPQEPGTATLLTSRRGKYVPQSHGGPAESAPPPLAVVQRWNTLGNVSWDHPMGGRVVRSVDVGTEDEWRERLKDLDDEDEYDMVRGFLETVNDPGFVVRTKHPLGFKNYVNALTRGPNEEEIMAFMRALYGLGSELDLPNTVFEGGPFMRYLQSEFSGIIGLYQGRILQEATMRREPISLEGVTSVAEQGGAQVRKAMIINAGATALKGVDLLKTADDLPEGLGREKAQSNAKQTIRNAGSTIRAVLAVHDDEIAFEKALIGSVFESVWEMIPAGGALAAGAKELLKIGLSRSLQAAGADDSPHVQVRKFYEGFQRAVLPLVDGGDISQNEAHDAINTLGTALY